MAARTAGRTHHEYWLISVPGDPGQVISSLDQKIGARGAKVATVHRFEIPKELRVGSLDELMSLSDDLEKMEMTTGGVTRKVGSALVNTIREEHKDRHHSEILTIDRQSLDFYIQNFAWSAKEYVPSSSCRDIAKKICSEIETIDTAFRDRMVNFSDANTKLNAADRSQKSNLVMKDLSDIVTEAHLPAISSELFVTVLAVVPNYSTKAWEETYHTGFGSELIYNPENKAAPYIPKPQFKPKDQPKIQGEERSQADIDAEIADQCRAWEAELIGHSGYCMPAVVPGSSQLIHQDQEFSLFNVTLFRACLKDFTARAREQRYTIREFTPPVHGTKAGRALVDDLKTRREEEKQSLIKFCKESFPVAFEAWIHLKALRTFVQSILRYGVPPDFTAILIAPNSPGENAKLRSLLASEYARLSSDSDASESSIVITGAKVYPYVFTEMDISIH